MLAQLGNIEFEGLSGFSSFQKKRESSYAKHNRIENKPKLQRTGFALDTITLGVFLHVSFANVEERIAEFAAAQDAGDILPLIKGNGEFLGNFVIESVTQTDTRQDARGNIWEASLDIELLESYEEDAEGAEIKAAKIQAIGVASNNPSLSDGVFEKVGAADGSENLTAARSLVRAVDGFVKKAEAITEKVKNYAGRVQRASQEAQQQLNEFKTKIEAAQDQYNNAAQMITNAQSSIEHLGDLELAAGLENVDTMLSANANLQGSFNNLNLASVGFVGQQTARRV